MPCPDYYVSDMETETYEYDNTAITDGTESSYDGECFVSCDFTCYEPCIPSDDIAEEEYYEPYEEEDDQVDSNIDDYPNDD